MEPLRPTAEETASLRIAEELDRIEAAVRGGSTDLRALGFWRVVAAIKRDQVLVLDQADQVGRIDRAAFVARVRFRAPVWVGSVLLVTVIAAGVVAIVLATRWTGTAAGIALLAAAVAWAIGVHSPTHQAFGWFAGIRFTDSFLGGPPPPRPGLKTDYATYLRAEPSMRAWFHASGAIATKIAPFVAVALSPVTNAPAWAVLAAAAFGILQIVTDVLFSTKTSDWKRFRRERAVAKDLRRR